MDKIRQFRGEYAFMSNFYPSPIEFQDLTFKTVEHMFQWNKTMDDDYREAILNAKSPMEARKLGREAPLRRYYEGSKIAYMYDITEMKYKQNPRLAELLADTGSAKLYEGNKWGDTFWGVDLATGEGKNYLGLILMDIRSRILGR